MSEESFLTAGDQVAGKYDTTVGSDILRSNAMRLAQARVKLAVTLSIIEDFPGTLVAALGYHTHMFFWINIIGNLKNYLTTNQARN